MGGKHSEFRPHLVLGGGRGVPGRSAVRQLESSSPGRAREPLEDRMELDRSLRTFQNESRPGRRRSAHVFPVWAALADPSLRIHEHGSPKIRLFKATNAAKASILLLARHLALMSTMEDPSHFYRAPACIWGSFVRHFDLAV